jgi:hypothetical protein
MGGNQERVWRHTDRTSWASLAKRFRFISAQRQVLLPSPGKSFTNSTVRARSCSPGKPITVSRSGRSSPPVGGGAVGGTLRVGVRMVKLSSLRMSFHSGKLVGVKLLSGRDPGTLFESEGLLDRGIHRQREGYAPSMVVVKVAGKNLFEMTVIQDDHVVQTLTPQGSN